MMFTIEEMSLIHAFEHSTRQIAFADMMKAIPNIQDSELKSFCEETTQKLQKATDADFAAIDFLIFEEDEAHE